MRLFKSKFVSSVLIFALVLVASGFSFVSRANAAALTAQSDTMNNETVSAASSQVIKFKISGTGVMTTSQQITLTWQSGFTFSSAGSGDVTITHGPTLGTEYSETIAATAGANQWGVATWSGQIATLLTPTASWTHNIASGDYVIITIASTHETNPSSAGSYTVAIATTAASPDTGTLAVPIVASSPSAVVAVSATVLPIITFSNDHNSVGFGNLSYTAATYANSGATGSTTDTTAHTLTIVTNAPSGYSLTYNGANPTSGSNHIPTANGTTTIASSASGTPGTEQFAISATAPTTGTIASGYANVGSSSDAWKFVPSAATALASSTGPAASDAIAMHYLANIAGSTPVGSYTTSITYIATGNF
jgi:hypothetical protein